MKKIIIATAISAVALVGCTSQSAQPAPTVTITKAAPAPSLDDPEVIPQPAMGNEELYLIGLKSMDNPLINIATDEQLLDMGYSVCEALESGFTVEDIIQYMATEMAREGLTSDYQSEAVGYIIGAADTALCPGSSTF
jgi:hypothetical protein